MIVKCDNCNTEFMLSNRDIKNDVIIVNKHNMQVTYFYCTECNKIYIILLRDYTYAKLENDLATVKQRIKNCLGQEHKAKQLERLVKLARVKYTKLKQYEDKLKRQYNNKIVLVNNELCYRETKRIRGEK